MIHHENEGWRQVEENVTGSEEVKEVSQGVGLIMFVYITVTKSEDQDSDGNVVS